MCNSEATSREHIPPRAIFPKAIDLNGGANPLKNLITVPSCDEHNTKKSEDDEYLVYAIVCHYQNNPIALQPLIKKMSRASQLKSKSIMDLLDEPTIVLLDGKETGSVRMDRARIYKCLEQMGRGLYFHEFGKKWLHEIAVVSPSFRFVSERNARIGNLLLAQMQETTARYFDRFNFLGENPLYFKYQRVQLFGERGKELIIRMVFYEGMEVYALSREHWEPDELQSLRQ